MKINNSFHKTARQNDPTTAFHDATPNKLPADSPYMEKLTGLIEELDYFASDYSALLCEITFPGQRPAQDVSKLDPADKGHPIKSITMDKITDIAKRHNTLPDPDRPIGLWDEWPEPMSPEEADDLQSIFRVNFFEHLKASSSMLGVKAADIYTALKCEYDETAYVNPPIGALTLKDAELVAISEEIRTELIAYKDALENGQRRTATPIYEHFSGNKSPKPPPSSISDHLNPLTNG